MRIGWILAVCSISCSSALDPLVFPPSDASMPSPDADVDSGSTLDAAVDVAPGRDAGTVCTSTNRGDTCLAAAGTCGSGFRYGCYGSTCSTTDLGDCTIASDNPPARYTEVCCSKLACTRSKAPLDDQCAEANMTVMDGRVSGWSCPYANGVARAIPSGDCRRRAASIPSDSISADYCCK